ncbi:MAG: hypothetical protein HQL52_09555 [Magnetococcales bacterium]|nr:hypothetical protein [Magnetococcales bacterium]
MSDLTELECDLLTEAFNIGLGAGSAALSELLGEEILVTVPSLSIQPKRPVIDHFAVLFDERTHTIRQTFFSPENETLFSGDAFLFISEKSSRALTEFLTDSQIPEEEVLTELGNIVLHACLGSLANMLDTELESDIPVVHMHRTSDILVRMVRNDAESQAEEEMSTADRERRNLSEDQDPVLLLGLHFKTAEREIDGDVMLFLELAKLAELKKQIGTALKKLSLP